MTGDPQRSPHGLVAALLVAAMGLGALGVRLYHLDRRTITHPELFAPGIPLPAYAVAPNPRHTVVEVLRNSLTGDIHPPAYYLGELAWTSIFGTKLFALRLPSAVLGTAAVLLLYAYGRREEGVGAALLAAALLALHGEHVFWSQHARMWVPLSCLALGSAYFLSKLTEQPRQTVVLAYAVITAIGLWTDYYFWPYFLALMVWSAAQTLTNRRASVALDAQVLAAVLGSPMLVYLHYQTQRGNFLSPELGEPLLSIVPFAAIAHSETLVAILIVVVCAALFAGAAAVGPAKAGPHVPTIPGPAKAGRHVLTWGPPSGEPTVGRKPQIAPPWFLLAGSLAASGFVLAALPPVASRLTIAITVIVPWIASLAWLGIKRIIDRSAAPEPRQSRPLLRAIANDLTLTLFAATLSILTVIHVVREPVLVERGLVMLAPFVVLLLARGLVALRNPGFRAVAVLVLLLLSAASTYESYVRLNSPRDYQGLAEQLLPQVRSDDVVVVENRWWATPIHYYLPPDRFHLILPDSLTWPLPRRVWIVAFPDDGGDRAGQVERLAAARLPHYEPRAYANARHAQAVLFELPGSER